MPRVVGKNIQNIDNQDPSQRNVIGIAGGTIQNADTFQVINKENDNQIEIDEEIRNLLNWLSSEQNLNPKITLKKALATAAYIYDLTNNQKGTLLVRRKDNSIAEIVLK